MPYTEQKVTSKHRWSDNTFTFTTTRPPGFEFRNGEFVTLGLRPEGKLIPRAYSIVSTNQDEFLEFLSIQVPDGPVFLMFMSRTICYISVIQVLE